MELVFRSAKYLKMMGVAWKKEILQNIHTIRQDPLGYLFLNGIKNFQSLGNMFLSPIRIPRRVQILSDVKLSPSQGFHLNVSDAVAFLVVIRILLHLGLGLSRKFSIIKEGYFTVDGLIFFITASLLVGIILMYGFVRAKTHQLSWIGNQSVLLLQIFSDQLLEGKSIFKYFEKDPFLLLLLYAFQQMKFLAPPLLVGLVVTMKGSPMFLASHPLVKSGTESISSVSAMLLSLDIVFVGILMIFFYTGAALFFPNATVISLCLRCLRFKALRQLNWRKRKPFYIQLELLSSIFGNEITSVLPFLIAHGISIAVAGLVVGIKLTSMKVSFVATVATISLAFTYAISTFSLSLMAELAETESVELLGDLRFDIAQEFKNKRIATLLTRRRLIRYNVGHFMFLTSGSALSFLMTILENTVSGIVMVVPSATCYFLQL